MLRRPGCTKAETADLLPTLNDGQRRLSQPELLAVCAVLHQQRAWLLVGGTGHLMPAMHSAVARALGCTTIC